MSILVSLTPSESKRLIAKAVAKHPLITSAMGKGRILISNGTTTGYCVESLLQQKLDIPRFACGVVTDGLLCQTPDERIRSIFLQHGVPVNNDETVDDYTELERFAANLTAGDVYIKGANAIDAEGNAGFLLAHPDGGNILRVLPRIFAQGVHLIIPTGLEKLVASVPRAQRHMKGIKEYAYTFGRGCGYICVPHGVLIHEIAAIELLTGATAIHVASGGIGGSEGAVSLVIEGAPEQEKNAVELLRSLKGEPPLGVWKKACGKCAFRCKYRYPPKEPAPVNA